MMKRFAKAMRNHPEAPIPAAVANICYYAAIAAAMVRGGQRISRLDNDTLRQGLNWSASQSWIDEPTRSLLREACASIPNDTVEAQP